MIGTINRVTTKKKTFLRLVQRVNEKRSCKKENEDAKPNVRTTIQNKNQRKVSFEITILHFDNNLHLATIHEQLRIYHVSSGHFLATWFPIHS